MFLNTLFVGFQFYRQTAKITYKNPPQKTKKKNKHVTLIQKYKNTNTKIKGSTIPYPLEETGRQQKQDKTNKHTKTKNSEKTKQKTTTALLLKSSTINIKNQRQL